MVLFIVLFMNLFSCVQLQHEFKRITSLQEEYSQSFRRQMPFWYRSVRLFVHLLFEVCVHVSVRLYDYLCEDLFDVKATGVGAFVESQGVLDS